MQSGGTAPERTQGERFWTTLVCVDGGGAGEISGRLCNPYLKGGKPFCGTLELLSEMEDLLDQMRLPQAYNEARHFAGPVEPPMTPVDHDPSQRGARATFAVRVLFRQNSSWQGSVTWIVGKRVESFRSVLELLMLVKNALDQKKMLA
jgi:hypothetical protein